MPLFIFWFMLNLFFFGTIMKKTLLALLIFSSYSQASGLLLQEAVTANAGTAGAGDGVYTETASANWTNPATMSYMGEQKTTVNIMLLDLTMDYNDNINNDNGEAHTVMPSAGIFYVRQLSDTLHLGMNFGVVGGSSIEYGDDWAGAAYLDKAFMSGMQINPSLSYKINDNLSVGVGAQFSYGLLEVSTSSLQTNLDTDWAYGFNAGTMYQAEKWALGLSYRSKVTHEFDVEASTANRAIPLGTELLIPTIIDLSGNYNLTPQITLLGSVQYHGWSDFTDTPIYTDSLSPQSIDRNWEDVWKFAIGADYQLNAKWALKAGFSYETSPQDDPSMQWVDLPVGEQYRYSMGASTYWNTNRIDFFYEYADFGTMPIDREIGPTNRVLPNLDGEFEGHIHFIGMNITF